MRVSVKPLREYPLLVVPFFWNQKRKYGSVLLPGLLWARVPKLFAAVAILYGVLDRKRSPLSPVLRSIVKVEQLAQWKASDLCDEKEKLALEYTEVMAYSDRQVTEELMMRLSNYFDGDGIVELTGLIAF